MKHPREITLRDGSRGIVRPIVPSDRFALAAALEELTPESRMRRFFFDKSSLSENELDRFTSPDGLNHLAYGIAVITEEGTEQMPIAVAHAFRDRKQKDLAEVAIVIADPWQGIGAGVELMRSLAAASLEVDIRRWFASMYVHNIAMKHLLNHFGTLSETQDLGNGVIEVIYDITKAPRLGSVPPEVK